MWKSTSVGCHCGGAPTVSAYTQRSTHVGENVLKIKNILSATNLQISSSLTATHGHETEFTFSFRHCFNCSRGVNTQILVIVRVHSEAAVHILLTTGWLYMRIRAPCHLLVLCTADLEDLGNSSVLLITEQSGSNVWRCIF